MASLNADYRLDEGSTFVIEFKVFDDELQPLPLTTLVGATHALGDYRFRMKVRRTKYRTPLLYSCGTTQNYVLQQGETHEMTQDGFFIVGGNTGFVRFVATWQSTAAFKPAMHFYDMEISKGVSEIGRAHV